MKYLTMDCKNFDSSIGFIGLGNIGFPIAATLIQSGYDVIGFDIDEDILDDFLDIGGEIGKSPKNITEKCRKIHVSVVNDKQTCEVIHGEEGILDGLKKDDGGIIIIHSTISPETVQAIDNICPDNVFVLDAAISGGPARAKEGDLAVMVGGEKRIFEQYRPIFDSIARKVVYTGEVGSGCVVKLTHQLIWYSTITATLEALNIGREYGVDVDKMIEVYKNGTASCFFVQNYYYWMEERTKSHGFDIESAVNLGRKDLQTYLELTNYLDESAPVGGVVSQQYPEMMAKSLNKSNNTRR